MLPEIVTDNSVNAAKNSDALSAEIEHLQARMRRLAEDKSYLQLTLRMMERINPMSGMRDMVKELLQNIIEAIGGTDIKIWYWLENELHFASFLGESDIVADIDDPLAAEVAEFRQFVETRTEPGDSLLRGGVLPGAWTWCFPLLVGPDLIGIIKLENINITGGSLRTFLPTFFSHAALILSNEIRNHLRQSAQAGLRLAASVFANSQEGITITDANNRILDVNAAFTEITGYAHDEVIGRDPKLLSSGRQDPHFYSAMWATLATQGSWRGEIWNRRKSGEIYAEILSIDVVRDERGQVQHYVGAFSDISMMKAHQSELERIAHYDTLTGLPNRRLLADRLNQGLARAKRSGRVMGICFLDLDGFKPVNDQYGHETGDQVLIEISHRLQDASRAEDTVARIGGDEFVLLFCDLTHEQECFNVLTRVLNAIEQPIEIQKQFIQVSASIGVTLFPRDDVDSDALMRHADQAMYVAKESGKGRFHIFDAAQDRLIKLNHEMLVDIEHGLKNDEFVLFYQPKVNMVSSEVIGAEALIRWQHPTRGLLAPGEFLPLLTGTELEITLGEWVIETALTQIDTWNAAGLKLVISVNIGANHLLRPHFMPRLSEALARHPKVEPGDLELEILESAAIDDLSNASRTLAGCIGLGVRFALDDFGTGYSSLTYFRKLPVGTLKIDQGFVRGLVDDPEDLGIIESVVGLAKAFNRPVIAEGVESIDHGAMLVMLGCPLGQGYGIARPMPAALLHDWVLQWHGEEIWETLGKYALPPDDLVLVVAVRSHQLWQTQMASYLQCAADKKLPALQHVQCPFGRWYYGSGISRYGKYQEFADVEAMHQAIHTLANDLVKRAQAESLTDLDEQLSVLQQLHEKLTAGMEALIARVKNEREAVQEARIG
jgi:diguanylate cyclase (GGDEF)-like protein/PAS domain S-box-containing protein